jgi:hypothetical protein
MSSKSTDKKATITAEQRRLADIYKLSRSIFNELADQAVTDSETKAKPDFDLFGDYQPTQSDNFRSATQSLESDELDSSFEDANPHLNYRSQQAQVPQTVTMARPIVLLTLGNHTDAAFLGFDLPIPGIPLCPYSVKENEQDGPVPTVKQQNIEKLQLLYEQYFTYKASIEANEATGDRLNRKDLINDTIKATRQRILSVYSRLLPLQKKIEHIKLVQDTLKPSLAIPLQDQNDDPQFDLDIRKVRDFIGRPDLIKDSETRLLETWSKLLTYSQIHGMGRIDFKNALFAILMNEHFDFIRNYPDTKLQKLAPMLAARFVNECRFDDAVSDLDNFRRKQDESLRFAIARLRTSLEKAAILWPANQRDVIKDFEIRKTLRLIVNEKTKAIIDKHSLEARQQGLTLSVDRMIRLAEDEERRTGKYNDTEKPVPISLYQTSVTDPICQKLDTLTDLLVTMAVNKQESNDSIGELSPEDAECNAATRSGGRYGSSRDSTRPYSLNRATAAVTKTSAAPSYITPSTLPTRAPAPAQPPRPATPFAAPSSDVNMRSTQGSNSNQRSSSYDRTPRMQDRSRDRNRERSRSDTRDRQQRTRDTSYDRSRGASQSNNRDYGNRSSSNDSGNDRSRDSSYERP